MALPSKKNKNIANPANSGTKRVDELLAQTNVNSTFLPKSILLEDLDRGIYEYVKSGDLKLTVDGKDVPVIFLTQERWSEFEKTWQFDDGDKNVVMPFITVRRTDAPRQGTNPISKYGIPFRKTFQYLKVPNVDQDGTKNVDIYKIPQPVAIDIDYEVRIFTHFMVDLNKFNEIMNTMFYSKQTYTLIKGHYIPLELDSISDESTMDQYDGQRFYNQAYKIQMLGYIQNENEFEVVKGVRKTIITKEGDR